jgi:hypothetical protein
MTCCYFLVTKHTVDVYVVDDRKAGAVKVASFIAPSPARVAKPSKRSNPRARP